LEKYFFARYMTFGAKMIVAIIVGIAINAKNPSIRFRIRSNEVLAPIKILAR
jgi:hypothetical protein